MNRDGRSQTLCSGAGCEAVGCDRPADWAYIGADWAYIGEGDLYLCAFHGGTEPVEGWRWIGEHRPLSL